MEKWTEMIFINKKIFETIDLLFYFHSVKCDMTAGFIQYWAISIIENLPNSLTNLPK